MNTTERKIRKEILELVERRGPVGWYGIEHGLKISRAEFPDDCNVMTYLTQLEAEGFIRKDETGKYLSSA